MIYFLILSTICEKSGALAFSLNSIEDEPQQEDFLKCFIILSTIKPEIKMIDIMLNGSIIYIIFIY